MKLQIPLYTLPTPEPEDVTAWIASRRAIIARDGYAIRAGVGPRGFTIEVKSLTPSEQLAAVDPLRTNVWCIMGLPEGASEFHRAADRDAVLNRLISTSNDKAQPRDL